MEIAIINLEAKMPTVEQAMIRLDQALRTAKQQKHPVLKLIHGYGSSGKGGAIRMEVQRYLSRQQSTGRVRHFINGEDFSPFHPVAREILQEYPALSKDSDYARANRGITLVLL